MTIPNLGVTQVIQQPGALGIAAQGLGGLGQLMTQMEQLRQEKAKNDAYNAYMGELTTTSRTARESAAEQARLAREQAAARATLYEQMLDGLNASNALQPGEYAALRMMQPEEGTKKVLELFAPTKLGGTERLVNPRGGPQGAPVQTMGVDTTPPPVTRPSDVAEAMEVALGLPRDTPIEQLSPEQRDKVDQYINRKVATGAARSTVSIATDTFASGLGKGAGERIIKGAEQASAAAQDLQTITELRGLLRQGIVAGSGANAIVGIGNALAQLGIGGDDIRDPIARTQAYVALVGERVGQKATLFGTGPSISDSDRKFATQMAGGDITVTPQTLNKLLEIADRQNRWIIQNSNRQVDRLPVGDDVKGALRVAMPESTTPQTKQFRYNGRIITGTLDPATGKYRGYINDRLVNLN